MLYNYGFIVGIAICNQNKAQLTITKSNEKLNGIKYLFFLYDAIFNIITHKLHELKILICMSFWQTKKKILNFFNLVTM